VGVHRCQADHTKNPKIGLHSLRRLAGSSCRQAVPNKNPKFQYSSHELPGGPSRPPGNFLEIPRITKFNKNRQGF